MPRLLDKNTESRPPMTMTADTLDRRRDRRPWLKRLADASEPYLYSAPSLILIIGVMMVPLVIGISYAFRDIQLLNPFSGGFIGLEHFRDLSKDAAFYGALKNTRRLANRMRRWRMSCWHVLAV